jgi:hypothetical protein
MAHSTIVITSPPNATILRASLSFVLCYILPVTVVVNASA